jgi:catechol 2,3-dioxygenase-like lactoylglutathione lyase family enzyme
MSIGRLHGIVIDCRDPQALAHFYAELLGMVRVQDDPDWVVIGDAADRPGVAFQRVPDLEPATWPSGERPQYRHFDVAVNDLDEGEDAVLALGGRRLAGGGEHSRVYADPAGHPFCLITPR